MSAPLSTVRDFKTQVTRFMDSTLSEARKHSDTRERKVSSKITPPPANSSATMTKPAGIYGNRLQS
jgi:hypothetical protein